MRLAADLRAHPVGLVFAAAADRHLHQHGGHRRQDHRGDGHDRIDQRPALGIAAAAHQPAEARQHADGARQGRGHGHDQRIAVADVRQLVRHHARDLLAAEVAQQAGGGGHGGMLGIAPRGEGVGLLLVDQVDARHRQAGALRQLMDDVEKLGRVLRPDFLGVGHAQDHLVAVPVGKQVHAQRGDEGDHEAGLASHQVTGHEEEARQRGEQEGGLEVIHAG